MAASRKEMRAWLAHMTDENREAIWQALYEAVHGETEKKTSCPNCKRDVYVNFPDTQGRARAAEILLNQGFGKPTETIKQEHTGRLELNRITQLTDEELAAFLTSPDPED